MLKHFLLATGLGSLIFIGSHTNTQAQDISFYLGGSLGYSQVDTGINSLTGTADLDEEDLGYKGFIGLQINKNIAIEGFYADLGKAKLTGNNGDTFNIGSTAFAFTANNASVEIDGESYGALVVLGFDLTERIYPFVKAGVHHWDAKATASAAGTAAATATVDGTDFVGGFGAKLALDENFRIRAEYEYFDFGGDPVHFGSIGAEIGF